MLRHDFVHSVWLSIPLALRYGAFCARWSDTPGTAVSAFRAAQFAICSWRRRQNQRLARQWCFYAGWHHPDRCRLPDARPRPLIGRTRTSSSRRCAQVHPSSPRRAVAAAISRAAIPVKCRALRHRISADGRGDPASLHLPEAHSSRAVFAWAGPHSGIGGA